VYAVCSSHQSDLRVIDQARGKIAGVDEAGHFFSNKEADYQEMAHQKPWRRVRGNMWINPSGETVATPDEAEEATAAGLSPAK
jgi:hypothetical protein